MILLEAEVHTSLLNFFKKYDPNRWIHHLTMARIVSRALRLRRSALIQTESSLSRYSLSYLAPALVSEQPVILVAPPWVQERLLGVEIPRLQEGLQTNKMIRVGDRWPDGDFAGLLLTSPEIWLGDRFTERGNFPDNIVTLIDQAHELEEWTRDYLTVSLTGGNWSDLIEELPDVAESLRNLQAKLTKYVFAHPKNPYESYLLEQPEFDLLDHLFSRIISPVKDSSCWDRFGRQYRQENQLLWASTEREKGQFSLHSSPVEIGRFLQPLWQKQPIVLMGGFLDSDKPATLYRQQLGLPELLCLKFSPHRSSEYIHLYLPDGLPFPNTEEFQGVLTEQLYRLLYLCSHLNKPVVILIEDVPLKAQVATQLAAEFGSRVVVENTELIHKEILICGWNFWHNHQEEFPTPQLLVIATLPIPSLENPIVAGRVAYYKEHKKDWFRLYLLPTALREIQRAVMPLRETQGVIAVLDNRVNSRSYRTQILLALEPYARINYIDSSWFS